jgi:hypothetical protein
MGYGQLYKSDGNKELGDEVAMIFWHVYFSYQLIEDGELNINEYSFTINETKQIFSHVDSMSHCFGCDDT